jgi:hypothetical protein
MEEVVGSIPTRSTNQSNNLARANVQRQSVCVMVCVMIRRFGACGKGFHRRTPGFHADVALPLQHPEVDVSGNRHDGGVCRRIFGGQAKALPPATRAFLRLERRWNPMPAINAIPAVPMSVNVLGSGVTMASSVTSAVP